SRRADETKQHCYSCPWRIALLERFWQARHPPRYAAYLIPSSPSFSLSSRASVFDAVSGGDGDVFAEKYGAKYDKAVECLTKDSETMLAFYAFPAEHWDHLRTTNPIESVLATVRHRTVRTRGSLSSMTAKLMVFKLIIAASTTWRRLQGQNQLPKVIGGVRFQDGIEVIEASSNHAA